MKKKYIFLAVVFAIMLVGVVSAATITINNRTLEARAGGRIVVTESIIITHDSVRDVHVNIVSWTTGWGTSSSDPVYFNSTAFLTIASTPTSAGNWSLWFSLNTTETTPANSTFEVHLTLVGAIPSQIFTDISLYVATGPTVEPDARIWCVFDVGPEINPSYTYRLTVEKIEP
jgi:hypothetical protein